MCAYMRWSASWMACSSAVGLVREQDDAVGRGDRELLAGLAERVGGDRDDLLDAVGVDVEHGAELVAAEPVGVAVGRDLGAELRAEAREQRVAGEVAERVVVALEAVEVEEHQQARVRVAAREPPAQRRSTACAGCPGR